MTACGCETVLREALEISEASFGEHHPTVATGLNNLAQLLQATNRMGESEPLLRRAPEIDEASFSEHWPSPMNRSSSAVVGN